MILVYRLSINRGYFLYLGFVMCKYACSGATYTSEESPGGILLDGQTGPPPQPNLFDWIFGEKCKSHRAEF